MRGHPREKDFHSIGYSAFSSNNPCRKIADLSLKPDFVNLRPRKGELNERSLAILLYSQFKKRTGLYVLDEARIKQTLNMNLHCITAFKNKEKGGVTHEKRVRETLTGNRFMPIRTYRGAFCSYQT